MKATGFFLLAVIALSTVRADNDADDSDFADSVCSNSSTAGGWSPVNLGNLALVEKLAPIVKQAIQDYVAKNTSLLSCPDSYDIDVDYACSQVVSGTNYRVYLTLDCDNGDDGSTNTDDNSVSLEAIIYVPLEGTPNMTIARRSASCSEFDDSDAKCYIGNNILDCDATSWTKVPSVTCKITNKSTQKDVVLFNCPLNGTAVSCNSTVLDKLPASVKDSVSTILSKWSAKAQDDADFIDLDDSDSGDNTDSDVDGTDDGTDNNGDDDKN